MRSSLRSQAVALRRVGATLAVLWLALPAAADEPVSEDERSLSVTATAYNSLPGQTHGDPRETAWGDRLEPGMKAIAVSHDLIPLGLGLASASRIGTLIGEKRYVYYQIKALNINLNYHNYQV